MSVYYTQVTERADYEGTVLSSTPVMARMTLGRPDTRPFRRVELDDREDGYYRDYQLGRYHSFGQPVFSEAAWEQEVAQGYIVLDNPFEDALVEDAMLALAAERAPADEVADGKPSQLPF
jgi:hypothetical protein